MQCDALMASRLVDANPARPLQLGADRHGGCVGRDGDRRPLPLATNGDASSGVFAIRFFFFLARGNVAVTPALAGPRGTTAARSGERGPKRPCLSLPYP